MKPMTMMVASLLSLVAVRAGAQEAAVEGGVPARPTLGLSISLGAFGVGRTDKGYKMFDGGRGSAAGGLEVAYDLRLSGSTRLALGLGAMWEDRDGHKNDVAFPEAALTTVSRYATASLRWRCDRMVQPFVKGALGMTSADFTLSPTNAPEMTTSARALFARAGVGLRVSPAGLAFRRTDGRPMVGWALGLEGGALMGTPLSLSLSPTVATGTTNDPAIAVGAVSLGQLSQLGFYAGASAVAVF